MPGAERGPDASLQRGSVALVLGMVHSLGMPRVGAGQFLSCAERVVPGAATSTLMPVELLGDDRRLVTDRVGALLDQYVVVTKVLAEDDAIGACMAVSLLRLWQHAF